jgi:hypothetical protein
LAKKRASNQPIVAEEPARPEEQFQLDQSEVAPPSSRPIGPRTSSTGSGGAKSYGARSARERRAGSTGASVVTRTSATERRSSAPRRSSSRSTAAIRPDIVNNMLENPTIVVTEEELHKEYGYVISDLRSMAILAVILVVALFVLAEVLPK